MEGDGSDFVDRGELLEHGSAGGTEDVGEGLFALAGVLAELEIEDGQAVGLLSGQVMDQVVAIAGEKAQGQVGFFIAEGHG